MAGGIVETNPLKLAEYCDDFKKGTKRLYDGDRNGMKACKGDMWFFELYHLLDDCAKALRSSATPTTAR